MLGKRITSLRKKANLTQEQLATKLNITRSALSQYELGTRNPDYDLLIKIADFFDVSIDYLLRGEDHYKDKARELRKQTDVRFAAVDGREFTDSEKEAILADALKRIDGIEKLIEENFKKKNEDKN
ncbi:helix-turn-helix domain-containing protein [Bacillus velezensis]|uniref:helix-turn-helix domain-containing protein n=1 Tax=Bacillus velezensis TaxID=492670 RepID=UPI0008DBA6CF|nr:helix-turn-helix domain-containing protein [Bacillus velezensis]APA01586.1 transcriptional regulator [Bacillus velezensis]QMT21563.1 helix-turn-helix domain-containing protein [Bacillus velezensis]